MNTFLEFAALLALMLFNGFLAMSDHMLRDIGVTRNEILAAPFERSSLRRVVS